MDVEMKLVRIRYEEKINEYWLLIESLKKGQNPQKTSIISTAAESYSISQKNSVSNGQHHINPLKQTNFTDFNKSI